MNLITETNKRIGQFTLDAGFVAHNQEAALAIMGRCIVMRCEWIFSTDTLEYLALSPDFDEIHIDENAPEYDVIISEGKKCIEFKRRIN